MVKNELGIQKVSPSRKETRFSGEEQENHQHEEQTDLNLVAAHRSQLCLALLDHILDNVLALGALLHLLTNFAIRPEETHVCDL